MTETTHHTEIFTEPNPDEPAEDYKFRHRMQRYRDPGYSGPWAGDDKYLFDPRCPKCVADKKAEVVSA